MVQPGGVVVGAFLQLSIVEAVAPFLLNMERSGWGGTLRLAGLGILFVDAAGAVHCVNDLLPIIEVGPVALKIDLHPEVLNLAEVWVGNRFGRFAPINRYAHMLARWLRRTG